MSDVYNKNLQIARYVFYHMAPEEFSSPEELDRASDSPDPSTRIEGGNQITSHFCGSKAVFLNRRSEARLPALASIITGHKRFSWNW